MILGAIFAVLSYTFYVDPGVQETLDATQREMPLYVFLLMFFGLFLILSGLLMLSKEIPEPKETL